MRQLHDLHILIYARVQRTLINLYIIKLIPSSDTVHVALRLPCVVTTYKLHRIMTTFSNIQTFSSKTTLTNPRKLSNLHRTCMHTAHYENNSSVGAQSEFQLKEANN